MEYLHKSNSFPDKFPLVRYKILGKTHLAVSTCGFGAYRINTEVNQHRSALEFAIKNGINLIDTSSNYGDGQSENLIGQVIESQIKSGIIQREDILIVSKGGYIQSENLRIASDLEKSGRGYPEVVKCSNDMWHCIHPRFIEHQITLSLRRLKIKKINVYLLHNPEYFLTYSEIKNPEEKGHEYYARIKKAFEHLEKEVSTGRIDFYGISSNTFGENSTAGNFTSLEKVIAAAEEISPDNHFAVIQSPLNLLEPGFAVNKNQKQGLVTALGLAEENGLGVLINRPLNAIINGRLMRLADFPVIPTGYEEQIATLLNELAAEEKKLREQFVDKFDFTPSERKSLYDCLQLSKMISDGYQKIETPNQFHEIENYYIIPRANYAISQFLNKKRDDTSLLAVIRSYAFITNRLLTSIESLIAQKHNEQNKTLHEKIDKYLNEEQKKLSLSQKAVLLINSLPGVSCTLVGMRKTEYVKDVLDGIKASYIENVMECWENL